MRWPVVLLLLAGILLDSQMCRAQWGMPALQPKPKCSQDGCNQPCACASELVPTTPQVPAPTDDTKPAPPPPGPSQAPCNASENGGKQRNCLQKLKAFVCYHPTSGNALPWLKVPAYTGPYCGTFYCTSGACGGAYPCPPCGACRNAVPAAPPPPVNPGDIGKGEMGRVIPPPQGLMDFPPRGCQGGSQTAVPTANLAGNSVDPAQFVNVEFNAVGSTKSSVLNSASGEFIAAVLITRQVASPLDVLKRANPQP